MRKTFFFYMSLIILLTVSCDKDNEIGPQCVNCPKDTLNTDSIQNISSKVFIVNEGNFTWGNASLSLYDADTKIIENQVFKQKNTLALGDVAQSLTIIDEKGYIVVNNSGKIEVININTMESIGTITGLNTPRYLLNIGNNRAYVTSLYGNKIDVINLVQNTVINTIPLAGWSEKMVTLNNKTYVTNMDNDKVYVIDNQLNILIDSIAVGNSPNSIVIDKNEKIWVLCNGGVNEDVPKLLQINTQPLSIENTLFFSSVNESPEELSINGDKTRLYFLNNGVQTISIEDNSIPNTAIISKSLSNFYGLGIATENNNEIYVSDAIDYVQQGIVYRYSATGIPIDSFKTAIIPGEFSFYKK